MVLCYLEMGCLCYSGRKQGQRSDSVEDILYAVAGTRQLASHYSVSQSTVLRVLSKQLLFPHHIQPVQALHLADSQQ
jgi:hypothetical protein